VRASIWCPVFSVALAELLEHVALGVGHEVGGVAEDIGVVADAHRRIAAGGEARPRDDDVDRAQRQALVDVALLAELGGREDVDLVAVVGALGDLLGGPDGLGVERLGGLVDVRAHFLELGLRIGAWARENMTDARPLPCPARMRSCAPDPVRRGSSEGPRRRLERLERIPGLRR
jgi:hypothetical protein